MPTRSNTALLAFALLAGGSRAFAAAPPPAFGFDAVDARAKALADTAFQDPGTNLPGSLQHMDHDRYASIRFKPEASRWRAAKLPFELQLFHEGWLFDRPVRLNEIVKGKPTEIPFNVPVYKDDVLAFLGASYFRALGKGQMYGLSARGLAIDTALASGEEFPRFVEFWFEKPKPKATSLTIYGLLDS